MKTKLKNLMIGVITILSIFSIYQSVYAISSSSLDVTVIAQGSEQELTSIPKQKIVSNGMTPYKIELSNKCCLNIELYSNKSGFHILNFYKDQQMTGIPDAMSFHSDETNYSKSHKYFSAGTYYILFPEGTYELRIACYKQNNRTVKVKEWYAAYSDYDHPTYYTYKATASGYLSITENSIEDNGSNPKITLCNSKGEEITEAVSTYTSDNKIAYAVQKNYTYKIKFTSYDLNYYHFYRIKLTFTAISEKSGSKKSKAQTVKFGSTANGLVFAEDSVNKQDWYKITNPKAQTVHIKFAGNITYGVLQMDVYTSSGKKYANYGIVSAVGEKNVYSIINTANGSTTLPKGTYYICIKKSNQKACGQYSIKMYH